jgi:arginase
MELVVCTTPDAPSNAVADVPRGRITPDQVVRLFHDVAAACAIVGLAIAQDMPWEAIATHRLLQKLALLADEWVREHRFRERFQEISYSGL